MTRPIVWLLLLFAVVTVAESESVPVERQALPRVLLNATRAKGVNANSPSSITHATDIDRLKGNTKEGKPVTLISARTPDTPPTTTQKVTTESSKPSSSSELPTNPLIETSTEKQKEEAHDSLVTPENAGSKFALFLPDTKKINETPTTAKQADLSKCFKDEKTTCFVSLKCAGRNTLATELEQLVINKEMLERRSDIEKCSVGVTLTEQQAGKYKFEYHLSLDNYDVPFKFLDRTFIMRNSLADLDCEPDCNITVTEKKSVKFGDQLYFTGDIRLTGSIEHSKKVAVRPETSSEADKMDLAMEPINARKASQTEAEEKKNDKSSLGTILLGCGGALVACIVLAVIVVTMVQRHQTAKNERRRVALAAAAAHTTGGSKPGSREASRRKTEERIPFIPKTQKTQSSMTSVSVAPPTFEPSE